MTLPEQSAPISAKGVPPHHTPFRARFSWALFDWANQPFFTIVTTFIFVPYFTDTIVGDSVKGQVLWADMLTVAGLILAVLSPFLGSIADAGGPRKPWIFGFQAVTVIGCVVLYWAYPNSNTSGLLWIPIFGLIMATLGAEFSIVFNNAQLPSLVPPERLGRLSGLGWGLGYVGGLLPLFAVIIISRPGIIGIHPPDGQLLFGLSKETFLLERLTGPLSALWLVIFVIPMFLFTPDARPTGLAKRDIVRQGVGTMLSTFRSLGLYRNALIFLVAYMVYNDGLQAVINFGGVYAKGTFGWEAFQQGVFGISITVIALIGCFVGGWLDDRFGSKPTILVAIFLVTLATLFIVSVGQRTILFLFDAPPLDPTRGLFASPQEMIFMVGALMLGVGIGPMQAASRTMISRLAPAGKEGEFYGLFALSGRGTTFVAPFFVGRITDTFSSQRAGILVILVFLVIGFILLSFVREERAQRQH